MKERFVPKKITSILLVAGLGLASLSACGGEAESSHEEPVETTVPEESIEEVSDP